MERITYQEVPQGMFEKLRAIETFIKTSSINQQLTELYFERAKKLQIKISEI